MAYFGEPGMARTGELLPLVEAERPDLIVHEHSDLAGWMIADRIGQRPVAHGYGPHLPFTRELAAFLLAAAVDRIGFGPGSDPLAGAVYLDPWPHRLQSTERVAEGRVLAIRPDQEPVDPAQRLPDGFGRLPYERTVYATLGTIFTDVATMRDVVAAVADLAVNLVLTTGPAVDPAELGPLPIGVVAPAFVPQALGGDLARRFGDGARRTDGPPAAGLSALRRRPVHQRRADRRHRRGGQPAAGGSISGPDPGRPAGRARRTGVRGRR